MTVFLTCQEAGRGREELQRKKGLHIVEGIAFKILVRFSKTKDLGQLDIFFI